MSSSHWIFFGILAAAALTAAFFIYRRREPPGRGRALLAMLRAASFVVLLLLLFDPAIPTRGAGGGAGRVVLLDASVSMGAADSVRGTRWDEAVRRARRAERGRILLFGTTVRAVQADSLPATTPGDADSRLAPALRAAAEAGAERVLVVSDGGVQDVAEAAAVAREAGLRVEMQRVPGPAGAERALAELDVPAWAAAGDTTAVRVGIASTVAGDTVRVSVLRGGRVVATAPLRTAGAGRVATATLRFAPEAPEGGGLVEYTLAITPQDAIPADDRRIFYLYVAESPTGVAVVSLRPGEEPRFLVPILEDALGLPTRGFLRIADGRYLRTGTALSAARPATDADVQRSAAQADLVVLHGLGSDSPEWARTLAQRARRLIVFPSDDVGRGTLPVELPPATPGDWYIAQDVPSSPIAAFLAGAPFDSVPPLVALRALPTPGSGATWAPLLARRSRAGIAAPALIAGDSAGRRWVVATGAGYWRWAFRGGAAREAYRTLWSALGGWLMHDERGFAPLAVRPARWVLPRGERVPWIAPGARPDSIRVTLRDSAGAAVLDTTADAAAGDSALTRAPAPGRYAYRAQALRADSVVASAEGPLTIDRYSPDYARPAVSWDEARRAGAGGASEGAAEGAFAAGRTAGRRPLHATPWPYLVVVALLCAEWVLRRRWGLR